MKASVTSTEMELRLTNVARASLEELLEDYRDFMRARKIAEWDRGHPGTRRMRELNRSPGANYETFRPAIEHDDPAVCANAIAGLVKLTSYLLDDDQSNIQPSGSDGGPPPGADPSQPTFFLQWGQVFMKALDGERLEYLPDGYFNKGWVEAKFIG